MAQRYTYNYGLSGTRPFTIHMMIRANLELIDVPNVPFNFSTHADFGFVNAYELCSAVAQTFCQLQGAGVRWQTVSVQDLDDADPDVVIAEGEQQITYADPTGIIGGGPDDRVMGLSSKVLASGRESNLRVGLLNNVTAAVSNDQLLNAYLGLPLLVKLRTYVNLMQRITKTGTVSVNRTWTDIGKASDRLYHGVARL